MNWFTRLFRPPHIHYYLTTASNYYGYPGERTCSCGHVQHRIMDAYADTLWEDGPHPIAESLRAQGLLETRDPKYKKA